MDRGDPSAIAASAHQQAALSNSQCGPQELAPATTAAATLPNRHTESVTPVGAIAIPTVRLMVSVDPHWMFHQNSHPNRRYTTGSFLARTLPLTTDLR